MILDTEIKNAGKTAVKRGVVIVEDYAHHLQCVKEFVHTSALFRESKTTLDA